MKKLDARKVKMLDKQLPNIIKMRTNANDKILKLLEKASKDSKIDVKVQTDILNKVKAGGEVHSDSSSQMDSAQKLELMKLWFGNAKDSMDAFSKDIKRTYDSNLKSIDKELQLCRDELKKIDDELGISNDKSRDSDLKHRRNKLEQHDL